MACFEMTLKDRHLLLVFGLLLVAMAHCQPGRRGGGSTDNTGPSGGGASSSSSSSATAPRKLVPEEAFAQLSRAVGGQVERRLLGRRPNNLGVSTGDYLWPRVNQTENTIDIFSVVQIVYETALPGVHLSLFPPPSQLLPMATETATITATATATTKVKPSKGDLAQILSWPTQNARFVTPT
ncbi:unnamed protein product [Protopolystoma xenopodis]|uniref:Uncharacterized protein n=1 Tax=Protopolystoma xenopodis TaxID=117903 RepID=A0A3S5AVN1_9PLAT|nr:unnamed protein product [Protopolystoma xenopodis]